MFKIISQTNNFENNYTIYIFQEEINEEYKEFFNQLNQKNIKYSSIYYRFKEKKKITNIKELNIDFKKIKRMTLFCDEEDEFNNNNKYFFADFFSIENIENNLIYLKIHLKCFLKPYCFEKINNFKCLQYLYINSLKFSEKLNLKLNNLKLLSCDNCKNIEFSVDAKELKELKITYNHLLNLKILEKVKFDKLEILNLSSNKVLDINILKGLNFKKLKQLYLYNNNIS